MNVNNGNFSDNMPIERKEIQEIARKYESIEEEMIL